VIKTLWLMTNPFIWNLGERNKTGDTLTLVKKGGKNMILYNMSNNPVFHALNELEYSYRNGKFSLKGFPAGPDFSPIDSFKWKQVGKEFEIEGTLLFPFLALSTVTYTYKKNIAAERDSN
jgi:hypothetical protein